MDLAMELVDEDDGFYVPTLKSALLSLMSGPHFVQRVGLYVRFSNCLQQAHQVGQGLPVRL